MDNKKYDIIIIGAGLGGLAAAATLSKNGKKVLLLEMHDKVGGFASHFKRKDFTFDVSLHNAGCLFDWDVSRKILEELDILSRIKIIRFDNFQRVIFPHHDFIIEKGIDCFVNLLKEQFPGEKEGIEQLTSEMVAIRAEFDEIEDLDVSLDQLEELYPMLPLKFPEMTKLVYVTFGELMAQYIKDEELKGIIGNLWWIYGIPPNKVASLLFSIPTIGYYRYGGGVVEGTSQKLSDAFADVITKNGGQILLNSEIRQILIQSSQAIGVETAQGERYFADKIISNASAEETFLRLIKEEDIEDRTIKRFRKKIGKMDLSLSGIQLYLGLNCDPARLGIDDHNITLFNSYDHMQNYQWIMNGEYDRSFFSITNYTSFDKTLAPEGKGVVHVLSLDHCNNWQNMDLEAYQENKKKIIEIILNKVAAHFPGLIEAVEVAELGTPLTMQRYTRSPEGSIYGLSQIVEQSGINRLTGKTPINGLYIVGSSIYPGAGYSSVVTSGYKTAKMLLKETI